MKNFTSKALPYLELVPTLFTVIAGLYFAIRAQSGTLTTDQILGWILFVFSLLAVSQLTDRLTKLERIEQQTKEVNDILKTREGKVSLQNVLSTRQQLPPLEKRLENAKELFITGGSLFRLSSEYIGLFDHLLANGCNIKILLLDPEAHSAEVTAKNIVYEIHDYETYKGYIKSSLGNFTRLSNNYSGQLEIKTSDYLPSFSLFGINYNSASGKIMVEFYVHNVPTRERPHIEVLMHREPFWFKFYHDQFISIWNEAKEYK